MINKMINYDGIAKLIQNTRVILQTKLIRTKKIS